jgi:hypothetical protein
MKNIKIINKIDYFFIGNMVSLLLVISYYALWLQLLKMV